MRIGKRGFGAKIKSFLPIEFGEEALTSYAGLEVLRRYLVSIGFIHRLRRSDAEQRWRGDFRFASAVLLLVGALLVGARRLGHIDYLGSDPLVARFGGLAHLPSSRSVSRALKKMRVPCQVDIDELSRFVVGDSVKPLGLSRVTLDMDGTVVTTGQQVGGTAREYNPHHRKNPSYYPITVMIAQTGHVWSHENRPGSVHHSHDADATLHHAVTQIRDELRHQGPIEIRADGAFFAQHFLEACDDAGVEYAIKVPMWPWLNIKGLITKRARWTTVDARGEVQGSSPHSRYHRGIGQSALPFAERSETDDPPKACSSICSTQTMGIGNIQSSRPTSLSVLPRSAALRTAAAFKKRRLPSSSQDMHSTRYPRTTMRPTLHGRS